MATQVKYSPMMEKYIELKNDYKDYIVFYRLGDFYEMFFDDALTASRELEIALTGKDAGVEERVPMCGIPFHAANQYIEKLVSRGYKVAIAEQLEDPKQAKGIVKRGIVKIVTPGTIDLGLKEKDNNYIASLKREKGDYILCYSDVTVGDGYVSKFKSNDELLNEIIGLHIKEVIIKSNFSDSKVIDFIKKNGIALSTSDKSFIPPTLEYVVKDLEDDLKENVGMLISYFIETQKCEPSFFKPFKSYVKENYLHLDAFTKKNLELTETLRYGTRQGSILNLIDKCNTAMGSRMLHKWIDKPLVDLNAINKRLDYVECFNNNIVVKEEIKNSFKNVYDLERIIGRISSNSANAKDLVWLRRSLKEIPNVVSNLKELNLNDESIISLINPHEQLYELLNKALVEDPPFQVKEGGLINDGYNKELDEIRNISNNGKNWLVEYEAKEKERTGLRMLKIGYNRVTGYYIEVTKTNLKDLPEDFDLGYERKSTLANAERFTSKELKEYEDTILNAKDKIETLEYEIFVSIRNEAKKYISSLQDLATGISYIDCFISLSDVALKYNYVRPTFNNKNEVNIVDGRHPVLETLIGKDYIVNDVVINKYNMMLITGPNMSGKSTYMRMFASIVILAQMGSFVPARVADLMIFDAIFTRIGASDDLVSGQSTFMVEMSEANYAIKNATNKSLVLFDEIGRGTATFDGMALAQAILEYLHEKVGAVTLFSTHYHELTALESKLKHLKNVHVEAKETESGVVFLHKVLDGPTDKSYGINVAKLAGLPKSLTERANQILLKLEEDNNTKESVSLDLFNFDEYDSKPEVKEDTKLRELKERLESIDPDRLSPKDALEVLYELKEML